MDQWLAQIYGTGGAEDIEKTAQHHLLQKLAAEEGIDLSGLSEEDIANLAAEVLGSGEEEETNDGAVQSNVDAYENAAQDQLLAKEAQAKFEEADFLGRVMAHAFTQEMDKIASTKEKTAAKKPVPKGMKGKPFAKKASAFDKLAEMRAGEMLNAVGIDPSTGSAMEGEQSSAPPQGPQQVSGQQGAGMPPGAQRPQARPGQAQQGQPSSIARAQGPQAQGPQGPQQGQPGADLAAQQQGGPQNEEFENAINYRALEMLASLGYDPEEIMQALSQGAGQGGGQGAAGAQQQQGRVS
jgi:hypothetical protein